MENVFTQQAEITEHPNLNNFDGFFQNHMTMKAGYLYPFMCKKTVPGDVFRISTAFGIKAMPLNFPIQSSLKVKTAYVYVPNRILMDDFKDMMAGIDKENGDTIVHPYIDQHDNPDFFKTGSLADYLDVPTTLVSSETAFIPFPCDGAKSTGQTTGISLDMHDFPDNTGIADTGLRVHSSGAKVDAICWVEQSLGICSAMTMADVAMSSAAINSNIRCGFSVRVNAGIVNFSEIHVPLDYYNFLVATMAASGSGTKPFTLYAQLTTDDTHIIGPNWVKIADFSDDSSKNVYIGSNMINIVSGSDEDNKLAAIHTANGGTIRFGIGVDYSVYADTLAAYTTSLPTDVELSVDITEAYDVSQCPSVVEAYDPNKSGLPLNALPFRAYEAACNTFFRNSQVNPFIVNGKKVYNKFCTTTASGKDTTPYSLYKVNWEPDPYTTCMPTPLAGAVQPLVGMTKLGSVTITDENGIATTGTMQFTNDGQTFTGGITITNPAASDENNRILSQAAMAAAGMSIYDFRACNSYVRFLETSLRSGLRYYEFIRGHFGKGPKRTELDMPLFLGGTSKQITVSQITQTSQGDELSPLGSFAGQANCFGSSDNDVNFTADDYGWVLGLIWIQPTPSYSQVLPKHFLDKDRFSYFWPEFTNLSAQPITMGEIAPLQAKLNGVPFTKTFGYQRPYYDYVQFTDQVHGQFRTTLKNMLINRLFVGVPDLGEDFIKVQPEETSNIFAVDAPNEDNYIGQIVVDCKMKRPIPRVMIPGLGH